MGDEISKRYFDAQDFSRFRERLDAETLLLNDVFERNEMSQRGNVAGFELEAWLVDEAGDPIPENERFLDTMQNSLVVPELAKFNIELNGSPCSLTGRVFSRMHDELIATWERCRATADARGCDVLAIGTLPTAKPDLFVDANMSGMLRYKSLNDRVMALRDGQQLASVADAQNRVARAQKPSREHDVELLTVLRNRIVLLDRLLAVEPRVQILSAHDQNAVEWLQEPGNRRRIPQRQKLQR